MQHPFDIYELTEDLSLRVSQNPVPMHRHNFEELLIISSGEVEHFIDFNRSVHQGPVIIYVAEGKVHQFIPSPQARGWVIKYNTEFLPDNKFHFYSHYSDAITFKLSPFFCIHGVDTLCRLMLDEIRQEKPIYKTIQHLLGAIVSKLENEGGPEYTRPAEASNAQMITFNNFLLLLRENYKKALGVSFYAEKLNTSVRNLNHICTNIFGKSVSEIIETRRLVEARQLLLNTGMTVSEVGFELGYNEKSYFTRVFKSKTGITPTDFREKMKLIIS
jgi:AraC family transcriptional activator of pobA